jgi:hypothetical protein
MFAGTLKHGEEEVGVHQGDMLPVGAEVLLAEVEPVELST